MLQYVVKLKNVTLKYKVAAQPDVFFVQDFHRKKYIRIDFPRQIELNEQIDADGYDL